MKYSTYTLKYCSIVNKKEIIKFAEMGGIGKKNKPWSQGNPDTKN